LRRYRLVHQQIFHRVTNPRTLDLRVHTDSRRFLKVRFPQEN
jgi:hypothetical protein